MAYSSYASPEQPDRLTAYFIQEVIGSIATEVALCVGIGDIAQERGIYLRVLIGAKAATNEIGLCATRGAGPGSDFLINVHIKEELGWSLR